jgi:hypothetical protein
MQPFGYGVTEDVKRDRTERITVPGRFQRALVLAFVGVSLSYIAFHDLPGEEQKDKQEDARPESNHEPRELVPFEFAEAEPRQVLTA